MYIVHLKWEVDGLVDNELLWEEPLWSSHSSILIKREIPKCDIAQFYRFGAALILLEAKGITSKTFLSELVYDKKRHIPKQRANHQYFQSLVF